MAQVSNVQSRTLRVLGSLSEEVKATLSKQTGVVILEKEGNGKAKTFVSAEDISSVIQVLSSNNLIFRPHFYSLFAKFNVELKSSEAEKLNDLIYAIVPDGEVSYSRVDENGHTGKVVVDRFEDYNTLRSHKGDITLYKFNRTKAQSRVPGPRQQSSNLDTEGFQPVQNRRPMRTDQPAVRAGDRPQRVGDRPQRAGDRPVRAGDRPQRAGDRPVRAGDKREGARTTRAPTSAPKTV